MRRRFKCDPQVVRIGKIVGFVECDIVDEQERLVARGSLLLGFTRFGPACSCRPPQVYLEEEMKP